MLVDGLHHARELTGTSECLYTMLRLLFKYVKADHTTIHLLSQSTLVFIPVLNVDGFVSISKHWIATNELAPVRKNRHEYASQADCDKMVIGVDLNRNYPYMFANDDEGSSGEEDVCSEDYRGPEPFSEPETRALSDFVSNWTNIKVVVNLHAFGNLMIVPFNYDSAENKHLKEDFPLADQFYNHIHEHGHMPKGNRMGNGRVGVKYPANGEASDYFLAEKGRYSMSPELGVNDKNS